MLLLNLFAKVQKAEIRLNEWRYFVHYHVSVVSSSEFCRVWSLYVFYESFLNLLRRKFLQMICSLNVYFFSFFFCRDGVKSKSIFWRLMVSLHFYLWFWPLLVMVPCSRLEVSGGKEEHMPILSMPLKLTRTLVFYFYNVISCIFRITSLAPSMHMT